MIAAGRRPPSAAAPMALWLAAASLWGPRPATADEAPAAVQAALRKEAGTRFEHGLQLYDAGNFGSALAEFEAAQRTLPSFRVWANIGLCEKQLFRYGEAVRHLRRYLDEGGAKVPADQRAAVERELSAIRQVVAEVTVRIDGGLAHLEVDEVATTLVAGEPLLLGPGRHALVATREGEEPDRRTIDVVSGQRVEVLLAPRRRLTSARLTIDSQPAGAALLVDGQAAGVTPLTLTLGAGSHELRATLPGRQAARTEVVVVAGQDRAVHVDLAPEALAAAPPKPWYRRWYVWTAVGVVVAGGAVAAGVGSYYLSRPDDSLPCCIPTAN